MLSITGLKNFYFIPGVTDMRCGYFRLSEIIKNRYHRNPYNGDVYIFMSRDRKKVKMVHFENHAYYIHEKCFTSGYCFMRVVIENDEPVYKIDWKDLVSVLESPVVKTLRLR